VTTPSPPRGLFSGLFARGPVAAQVSDEALLQAMVDVELALVRALVRAGLAPAQAERDLIAAADASALDIGQLGCSAAEKGTPIPALVSALRERLGDSAAATVLHRGATSQDILDTAIMLVARRALEPLLTDVSAAAELCAGLAERHRNTLQAGRTLLQHAVPVTFGLKAAEWLTALDGSWAGLAGVREQELAVQLGGAAGTLATLGDRGLAVVSDLAEQLELAEPDLPWHAIRLRPARVACSLGVALGAMGKIAGDVVLLAQTEVDELAEGQADGRGGSSTMPHKRNPVGAVAVVACAQRGPGLVSTILSAMGQEQERAAGAWQAEWEPLLELLRLTGSAASALRELLDGLEVHADRMRANLDLTHGLLMSESVAAALAQSLGRPRAQELVETAARRAARERRGLKDVLLEQPEVASAIDPDALERALSPESYLGVTDELIDRALAAHRGRGRP
jgi:3-carboxy-cis,cis-muconate cycloisomerase